MGKNTKIDLRTCHWTELPNGWTLEGAQIIMDNFDIIHERIDDYIRNSPEGDSNFGKFIGKFYNPVGEPCPALRTAEENFFYLLFNKTVL